MLNDRVALTMGSITFTLGILFSQFLHFGLPNFAVTDFLAGLFLGLSAVMNLKYLVSRRTANRKSSITIN
ncbi:MAG: hypothetical protein ACQCN3_14510 [Candidatus Bathyarchaeia archaeon]